jgi:hypothetical protein
MERQSPKRQHGPAKPLASRHIFLETQVYRVLGHNPANRAMTLLKEHATSHRVVLHTTDITLPEVRRQIRELVLARQRELRAIEGYSPMAQVSPGSGAEEGNRPISTVRRGCREGQPRVDEPIYDRSLRA